jgi:hypothetical protein
MIKPVSDSEGIRLINGGRKAALEETLMRLKALLKVDSFSADKKLEKFQEMLEADIRRLG